MNEGCTVILANGSFPANGTIARKILDSAQRIVACDGAADAMLAISSRTPDVIVGDFDSLSDKARECGAELVHVEEQETNDLAKAVRLCRARGWREPVILGATGKREDHALANLFLALDARLELVTDTSRFIPLLGERDFEVKPGSAVSIFAPDPATHMTSSGLEWPLDGVEFKNLYCAALNRATAGHVTVSASHPVLVCLQV